MTPERRFRSFGDYLWARFGERLQKVTLAGPLVCPDPRGREQCPYCSGPAQREENHGRGLPVHEQIRRGINFSRRHGHGTPRLLVNVVPPAGACPPLDHIEATLAAASEPESVALLALTLPPGCADDGVAAALARFATTDREVWLDLDGAPEAWPMTRDGALKAGIAVDFGADGAASPEEHAAAMAAAVDRAAALVRRLEPDAVGIMAPVIVDGTPEAERYAGGALEEPELEEFAERAARFLERIPAEVAVSLATPMRPSDTILGPRWALNRQKVQEAVADALEVHGTVQGSLVADQLVRSADGQ